MKVKEALILLMTSIAPSVCVAAGWDIRYAEEYLEKTATSGRSEESLKPK